MLAPDKTILASCGLLHQPIRESFSAELQCERFSASSLSLSTQLFTSPNKPTDNYCCRLWATAGAKSLFFFSYALICLWLWCAEVHLLAILVMKKWFVIRRIGSCFNSAASKSISFSETWPWSVLRILVTHKERGLVRCSRGVGLSSFYSRSRSYQLDKNSTIQTLRCIIGTQGAV